jgi:hypothetical protein
MQRFMIADPLARRLHRLRSPLLLQQISSKMFAFSVRPAARGPRPTDLDYRSTNTHVRHTLACQPNLAFLAPLRLLADPHTLWAVLATTILPLVTIGEPGTRLGYPKDERPVLPLCGHPAQRTAS